jgi:hypothetical protein
MDSFVDQTEFWYEKGGDNKRDDDKWWMPTVKVPSEGLSDVTRKWLQYQKECVNQVLKAAMAINAQVLMEMEIPEVYIESLPKVHRSCMQLQLFVLSRRGFFPICIYIYIWINKLNRISN